MTQEEQGPLAVKTTADGHEYISTGQSKKPWTWSFSSLELAKSCACKYRVLRHEKLMVEPSGHAAEIGSMIHEKIEGFLKTGVFDFTLLKWEKLLREYHAKGGKPEVEYAFNRDLKRVGFKDADVWFRAIIDFLKIDGESAEIADWKTGKVKPTKQMSFYAWVVFLAHPEVTKIKATFEWINHSDHLTEWYHRDDMDSLFVPFKHTIRLIQSYEESQTWPEQPGFHCRWCSIPKTYCSQGKDALPTV